MARLSSIHFLAFGMFALVGLKLASCENCAVEMNLKYYEELDCDPVKSETNPSCITSYNCGAAVLDQKADKCYYRGHEYSIGDVLDENAFRGNCIPTCTCHNNTGRAQFSCPNIECPEGFHAPLRKNCIHKYSHDKCCSVGQYCSDEEPKTVVAKCQHGGNEYVEGESFYPDEVPCKKCICKPGFNGTLASPWCEEIYCEIMLRHADDVQQNCAPVYYGHKACCPHEYHCQTASGTENTGGAQQQNDGSKCKFGNQLIDIGLTVPHPNKCTTCTCRIPPFVHCVVDTECAEKRD